jgi:hypothetical protein
MSLPAEGTETLKQRQAELLPRACSMSLPAEGTETDSPRGVDSRARLLSFLQHVPTRRGY